MRSYLAFATAFGIATMASTSAFAVGEDEVSGNLKGTIGGALLGAELVLVVEAAIDVEPPWWYVAGGVLGAVGGGVAGHFIEESASARVSMLMLAGGLTLAIPTTVAVLSATAYEPPADYLQDTPPDEPAADAPAVDAPAPAPATPPTSGRAPRSRTFAKKLPPPQARLRLAPPALLDFSAERVALSIPAVQIGDVFTKTELFVFGVKQATEVRVPVLSVAF